MKALITGASSGLGKDMAIYLSSLGYDLILVARREDKLIELKEELKTNIKVICLDLSIEDNCYKLYEMTKEEKIDFLINNAGFGLFGFTNETSIEKELEMINLNIKTVHILTKLYLKDFFENDNGRILNVSSSAGFLAGPYLNTYYATKNYVTKFSLGIYEELKQQKSNVHISILCPGPVVTEFNKTAGGNFVIKGMSSKDVSKYAIDKALKNKLIIVPGITTKLALFFNKFLPTKLSLKAIYHIQKSKNK